MHQSESRHWFQSLVAGVAVDFGLPDAFAARIAVSFLAAGAIAGFARLLTLLVPAAVRRCWPSLEPQTV